MHEKFYVSNRYGTAPPLEMVEYTREIHDLIMADTIRMFTIYGPDKRTPMGSFYEGLWYPDARTYAEASGIDTSWW